MSKTCNTCNAVKELSAYNKNAQSPDGLKHICVECDRERSKAYYIANKEASLARSLKWHQENSDKARASTRKSNLKHKEKRKKYVQKNMARILSYQAAWAKKNKGSVNALRAKRRARKKNATPLWYVNEREDVLKLYEEASILRDSGVEVEVDHIIPLQSELVCGLHCLANLQILSRKENLKKSNRFSVGG